MPGCDRSLHKLRDYYKVSFLPARVVHFVTPIPLLCLTLMPIFALQRYKVKEATNTGLIYYNGLLLDAWASGSTHARTAVLNISGIASD